MSIFLVNFAKMEGFTLRFVQIQCCDSYCKNACITRWLTENPGQLNAVANKGKSKHHKKD